MRNGENPFRQTACDYEIDPQSFDGGWKPTDTVVLFVFYGIPDFLAGTV
jgi:hypothetical protein